VPPCGCSVNSAACHVFCAPCSSSRQLHCVLRPLLFVCSYLAHSVQPPHTQPLPVFGSPAGRYGLRLVIFFVSPALIKTGKQKKLPSLAPGKKTSLAYSVCFLPFVCCKRSVRTSHTQSLHHPCSTRNRLALRSLRCGATRSPG